MAKAITDTNAKIDQLTMLRMEFDSRIEKITQLNSEIEQEEAMVSKILQQEKQLLKNAHSKLKLKHSQ